MVVKNSRAICMIQQSNTESIYTLNLPTKFSQGKTNQMDNK